jgi:N-carbamoyl-L-amino-acid hydrolase
MRNLHISSSRLLGDLDELAAIGGRADGGVDRVAGSQADLDARAWLAKRMEFADLEPWTDETGNVFGRRPGGSGPWLLVGSHTDTVPAGGRLDGAYGVIAGLEVLRTLHEMDHPAADGLEVVSFWDEEGARPDSTGGLVGSTALCAGEHIRDVRAYLELHIEQGPRMESAGLQLATVEGIVGIDRYSVRMRGEPNHAGTTPLSARADAGRAAAKVATSIWEIARRTDATMAANAGSLEFHPGAPNVVPGEATVVVEFRATRAEALHEAADELASLAHDVARQERCVAALDQLSHKPVVRFDAGLCGLLDGVLRRTGVPHDRMTSYAGHDAGALSASVPAAMLFVPSKGGVSHSPCEYTPESLLVLGCQTLLEAVLEFHESRSE